MARVLWITGRPASGKTTLGRQVVRAVIDAGRPATLVDSDEVRQVITPEPEYTEPERTLVYRALAYLAERLAREGVTAVVAATAHEERYRRWARQICPDFALIYADCSLETCLARDPKGLYGAAAEVAANTLPGVGVPFEEPEDAEAVVDTERPVPEERVQALVRELGLIPE